MIWYSNVLRISVSTSLSRTNTADTPMKAATARVRVVNGQGQPPFLLR